jgi:hypothetical protein
MFLNIVVEATNSYHTLPIAGRGAVCDSRSVVTDAVAGVTGDGWSAITVPSISNMECGEGW